MEALEKDANPKAGTGVVWKTVDHDPPKLKELMAEAAKTDEGRSTLSLLLALFRDRPESPEKDA